MGNYDKSQKDQLSPQLATLIDTLELITEQTRAYERVLPPDNTQARMAVAMLGELAHQALAEARDYLNTLTDETVQEHPFSVREQEVLTLAAQGLTNREIAYRLSLSERTIQFHMNNIFNKTTTSSRTEAATLALQRGWIDLDI